MWKSQSLQHLGHAHSRSLTATMYQIFTPTAYQEPALKQQNFFASPYTKSLMYKQITLCSINKLYGTWVLEANTAESIESAFVATNN